MNSDCNKTRISVCVGPRCTKNFSKYVLERAKAESKEKGSVLVDTCNCCGNCEKGVSVRVEKGMKKDLQSFVDPIKIATIVKNN